MLLLLCPTIAYYATTETLGAINKKKTTTGIACAATGAIIVVIHLCFAIMNLIYGASILQNIAQGIAGIIMLVSGISDAQE